MLKMRPFEFFCGMVSAVFIIVGGMLLQHETLLVRVVCGTIGGCGIAFTYLWIIDNTSL